MLKTFVAATVLSVAVLGASVLPASASFSSADCAYAQRNLNMGVGPSSSNQYNADAVTVQNCKAQGL